MVINLSYIFTVVFFPLNSTNNYHKRVSYKLNEKLPPIYHRTSQYLTAHRFEQMLENDYCTHAGKHVNILGVNEYVILVTL